MEAASSHLPHSTFSTSHGATTRSRNLDAHSLTLSSNTSLTLPSLHCSKPSKTPKSPPPSPIQFEFQFAEKMLFLDSLGIDLLSLLDRHPSLLSSLSLPRTKSTLDYLRSLGFSSHDFRRISGMCPEILTYTISDLSPVFTFLLREANVKACHLRRVIHRRPRLLACSVQARLRPTLYFLQTLGVTDLHRHTSLLSCSVEDKFVPRMDYMEKTMGFSRRDVLSMVRRFPQLFCYSIKHNFEPKFSYFATEMKRDLGELREFPHYFSFSLDNRIKPRHLACVSKGVYLPLPVMLKSHETLFRSRLET